MLQRFLTARTELNSSRSVTLKLASSVLRAPNHGRLKLAPESGVRMAGFQQPSITMLQSQKMGKR